MLREPAEALEAMTRAAMRDGIDVCGRSGFRSLRMQRNIWNRKFEGDDPVYYPDGSVIHFRRGVGTDERVRGILHYIAFPGTSRHHWGTDVDVAQTFGHDCARDILDEFDGSAVPIDYPGARDGPEPPGEDAAGVQVPSPAAPVGEGGAEGGGGGGDRAAGAAGAAGKRVAPVAGRDLCAAAEGRRARCIETHRWLIEHAADFGFYLVYDRYRGGFQPEPWHWSYLAYSVPALERYLAEVTADHLRDRGIDGADLVLSEFDAYRAARVLGINRIGVDGPGDHGPSEP